MARPLGNGGAIPDTITLLNYDPSGYWFVFDDSDMWRYRYSPAADREVSEGLVTAWAAEFAHVELWLRAVRRELDAPDLWAQIADGRALAGGALENVANTPFTENEKAEIARNFEEVKQYIGATHDLTSEQRAQLESRLDYLLESAGRMGRVDWRNALVGALLGAVLQGFVPQLPVVDAIQMIMRGVGAMFGFEPPQLN